METEIEILKEKIIALQKEINQKDNELAELIKFNEDKTLIHIIDEKDYYKEAYNNQLKKNCELKEQIVLSESILVKMKRELSCALNCDLSSDTSGKTPVTGITEDIIIKKLSALEHEILQLKKEDFCGASLSDSLLSSIEMCFDKQTTEIIELILEKINSNPSLQKNIASCGSLPKNVKIADAAPRRGALAERDLPAGLGQCPHRRGKHRGGAYPPSAGEDRDRPRCPALHPRGVGAGL